MRSSPQVNTRMARVPYNVAAYGVNCISEEHVRLGHDLIGYNGYGVEGARQTDEFVHVFVQFLLPRGQHFASKVLASEVCS